MSQNVWVFLKFITLSPFFLIGNSNSYLSLGVVFSIAPMSLGLNEFLYILHDPNIEVIQHRNSVITSESEILWLDETSQWFGKNGGRGYGFWMKWKGRHHHGDGHETFKTPRNDSAKCRGVDKKKMRICSMGPGCEWRSATAIIYDDASLGVKNVYFIVMASLWLPTLLHTTKRAEECLLQCDGLPLTYQQIWIPPSYDKFYRPPLCCRNTLIITTHVDQL